MTTTTSTKEISTAPLELAPVVGGRTVPTGSTYEVRSPYNDDLVAVVHRAGPAEIEAAIAGAVRAFQVTRKLPAWRRAEILSRIADAIDAAREDFARTIALEAGKPDQDRAHRGGARGVHLPRRCGGDEADPRRADPARLAAGHGGPHRPGAPRAARPDRRHLAVQLPAEPRRAQGRAGAGRREPDRAAACEPDAGQRAQAGADRARGRLAGGGHRGRAVDDRGRGAARRGRPLQAADVHGEPRGGVVAQGPRRHEARDARARRQRRRGRGRRRRRRVRGRADRMGRHGQRGPDVHLGAARLPRRVARRLRGRPGAALRRARRGRPARRGDGRRSADRHRRRRACRDLGPRGGRAAAPASSPAASGTGGCSSRH